MRQIPCHPRSLVQYAIFCLLFVPGCLAHALSPQPDAGFDIAPFALPHSASGEYFFEEPRDIQRIVITFRNKTPDKLGISYLRKTWPSSRVENARPFDNPCTFGWFPIDDWFNTEWKNAETKVEQTSPSTVSITFQPLTAEFPELEDYPVTFRRTLGLRIEAEDPEEVRKAAVFTVSPLTETELRVQLDAGKPTPGGQILLSSYNSAIESVLPGAGLRAEGRLLRLSKGEKREFSLKVSHMRPAHVFSNDDGQLTFALDEETFTISLSALEKQGPIWFEDLGVFITRGDDPTTFEMYQTALAGKKTILEQVLEEGEQSLGGAMNGQPARHRVAYPLGCKYARERFWIEPNGDIVLREGDVHRIPGKDTERFKNKGNGRFFFGLERWVVREWSSDPAPVLASNLSLQNGGLKLDQKVFAVPLERTALDPGLASDDPIVALVRFRFENQGAESIRAELPLLYASDSHRSENHYAVRGRRQMNFDGNLVPQSPFDKLTLSEGLLSSEWQGEQVLRARIETSMEAAAIEPDEVVFAKQLQPGESCEVILKIPWIALDTPGENQHLAGLDYETCYREAGESWRMAQSGARIRTPEPILDTVHSAHLSHVYLTDIPMPDDPSLINTSVGTSIYGNFSNESCMIIHDLDERGLHEEARRRLELWIKYQGTVGTLGNFTDHDGVFFGAGGFEHGNTYNQHHGWVLWCMAEHYFLTGDEEWLRKVSGPIIQGMEWVFRQRRETLKPLPHSRGWESGFLPAGALEDVGDYCYWLSTNTLTWRGVDNAAKALAAVGHPDSGRLQREADAYREDLIRGFEMMRQHTPLQRLRNGRWVPIYPSRLYLRGRDIGWIREILEGSVYLLISGLYSPDSKQAQWILDDFQDNRYMNPPYGYPVPDPQASWFDHGGLSIQPNLLAGLMPHLDRDEPEIAIWMFLNCLAACYSSEINGMVEHPFPFLGFSNAAHYKTSDEANATSWLRALFVHVHSGTLHLGQAIPREWFTHETPLSAEGAVTRFGTASVTYRSRIAAGTIRADVNLDLRQQPGKILLRFRHPAGASIRSVKVNSTDHERFDPKKGDVDLTGLNGRIEVEAGY